MGAFPHSSHAFSTATTAQPGAARGFPESAHTLFTATTAQPGAARAFPDPAAGLPASTRDAQGGPRVQWAGDTGRPASVPGPSPACSPGLHSPRAPARDSGRESRDGHSRSRKRSETSSPGGVKPPAKRTHGVPEPTDADVRLFQAKRVDEFCATTEGYDRRNPQDIARAESVYYSLDLCRQLLIASWEKKRADFLKKKAERASRDEPPTLSPAVPLRREEEVRPPSPVPGPSRVRTPPPGLGAGKSSSQVAVVSPTPSVSSVPPVHELGARTSGSLSVGSPALTLPTVPAHGAVISSQIPGDTVE